VVYLEVKTAKGTLSDNQKKFQAQCLTDGIPYWVIRSVEDLDKLLASVPDKESYGKNFQQAFSAFS